MSTEASGFVPKMTAPAFTPAATNYNSFTPAATQNSMPQQSNYEGSNDFSGQSNFGQNNGYQH
jgi:hypothetical protein